MTEESDDTTPDALDADTGDGGSTTDGVDAADDIEEVDATDGVLTDGDGGEVGATDGTDAADAGPGRGRTLTAVLLGVVSVVLLYGSLLGFWTIRTATDSERFEERIEEILQSEEVSAALARVVLDEVGASLDLRGEVVAVTPDSIDPVVDLLFAGLQSRLEDRVAELIRQPAISSNVAAVAGTAHELAIKVLEGDRLVDFASVEDGEVRINLVPLAARALDLLPDFGLLADADIPEFERGGDPAQQVAELEDALGRDLPENFAQPVIFTSATLQQAGDTVDLARSVLLLAKRAFWILLIAGLGVGALAIWTARRRLRTATYLVAGLLGVFAVTAYLTDTVAGRVPNAVVNPGASATVNELVQGMQRDLNRMLLLVAVIAVAGLAAAYYVERRGIGSESPDDQMTAVADGV